MNYLFSLPTGISAGGVTLDIPIQVSTGHNSSDKQAEINYLLQTAIIGSTLEHATPEQLFNTDPQNPPNAFSAVKGLQIAAEAGQRIYQVTPANKSTTLPALNLDSGTMAEIEQAVDNGMEVITHTDEVSVPGYSGAGYIIFDPETGDSAYRISGGQNGAFAAIGYIVSSLEMFFDLITSVAAYSKTKIPVLNSISNFMKVAKHIHSFLDKGLNCNNASVGPVIFFFTAMTVLSLVMADAITSMTNPLVGFGVGLVAGAAVDAFIKLSPDCR